MSILHENTSKGKQNLAKIHETPCGAASEVGLLTISPTPEHGPQGVLNSALGDVGAGRSGRKGSQAYQYFKTHCPSIALYSKCEDGCLVDCAHQTSAGICRLQDVPGSSADQVRQLLDRVDAAHESRKSPRLESTEDKWPHASPFSSVRACQKGSWMLWTYNKQRKELKARQYKCDSWRHEGECSRRRNQQDFARICQAIDDRGVDKCTYVVLTVNRKDFRDPVSAYLEWKSCWAKLRKRLVREYGKLEYVMTMERHRDGFPHGNLIIYNQGIYDAAKGYHDAKSRHADLRTTEKETRLSPHVTASGFGKIFWMDPIRSSSEIAAYIMKIVGEVAKEEQLPINAPRHFRRIRSSNGFLPKTYKQLRREALNLEEEVTGIRPVIGGMWMTPKAIDVKATKEMLDDMFHEEIRKESVYKECVLVETSRGVLTQRQGSG
jgi:hypothetical protein